MTDSLATHRAHMPSGTERFLDVRSLAGAHRRLAELLAPGMDVLDVGCGTGAITEGIAQAVAPAGEVVGIDVNAELIAHARTRAARHPNLSFEVADIAALARDSRRFDVVTAARLLLWLEDPASALHALARAAKPGGLLVVLDYNLTRTRWEPTPSASVLEFYDAFLRWRAQAGMDNEMADRLPSLFAEIPLKRIRSTQQLETARRGDEDFEVRIALWGQVIATRGHQVVQDGLLEESLRARAEADFQEWARTDAQSQTLWLAATEGVVGA
jgi:ubiquinone/menaquinone biosynthesis C-methylase UbiE